MSYILDRRVFTHSMTRRDFLWLTSLTTASVVITGCAVNPVTGENQLMLVSETGEINLDRTNSPHQFSADYGTLQDRSLNNYINQVGKNLANHSHRPRMPYSFRGVNATYANAYAFPGGSIAATRGILLSLNNEAELAALLGHEIGHVNARHSASQMSKNLLLNAALTIGSVYVTTKNEKYGPLIAMLGQLGAGMLLAHYSREDERQADALGLEYMTRIGNNPQGMVGLMNQLRLMSNHQPSIIETMFATHPMSEERYQTTKLSAATKYQKALSFPLQRERYMDNTAKLRASKTAIQALQKGEELMKKKQYASAETYFKQALRQAPADYAGLVMMAKCQLVQEKSAAAMAYAQQANQVYPQEAQAYQINGVANLMADHFETAYHHFANSDRMLPGNPNIIFFKGLSLEGMQRIEDAAAEYHRYLQLTNKGDQAKHAQDKLIEWGFMRRNQN